MANGNSLVCAAKCNDKNPEGDVIHAVHDHILEVTAKGDRVDVWDLNKILDPYRDAKLKALDIGAVCINVDMDPMGQTIDSFATNAEYGDVPGVGAETELT
ncbi:aryl-sulfate sulfotransferase [Ferrimonas pelagia]|uniref:Uncharacterized protein n=1 Tax=Ferrimonas pelagia TaxID=1177826 RepID=A0ABP9EPR4_9GAMM